MEPRIQYAKTEDGVSITCGSAADPFKCNRSRASWMSHACGVSGLLGLGDAFKLARLAGQSDPFENVELRGGPQAEASQSEAPLTSRS